MFSFELIFIWVLTAFTVYIGVFWMYIAIKQRNVMNSYPIPKRYPSLSVLIPAFNEGKNIGKCIDSVRLLKYPSKIEVIVINDGSTDNTLEIAEQYRKKRIIKLINQENKGKGAALNSGLKIARGEIIAVMDADSVVEENALDKLVGHFEDKRVGAVVSSIKAMKTTNFLEKLQSAEYIMSCMYRRLGSMTDMIYVTPGVFSLFRKEALIRVGGIDENNLTEDLEIALRLRSNGYEIRNSMAAMTRTVLPRTLKEFYRQRIRWYRGLVKNTIRYKRMLFNPEYGYLGTFQLPMNIVFPFISMAIIALFIYSSFVGISDLITELSIVGLQFKLYSLQRMLLSFDWRVMIPWVIGLVTGLFIILFTYRKMGESIGKSIGKINTFIFLLIYFTIINIFWTIALLKELKKSDQKW